MHSYQNQTVDIVLAMLLMIGGVIGAQFGAVAGEKAQRANSSGSYWRDLVIAVCIKMAWGLIGTPAELYSIGPAIGGGH